MERKQTFSGEHADVTDKILKAFFKVYNTLGYGFAERVYENALVIELKKSGLRVEKQK
jgi:GxxExxY protein